jgi:hypothetical protein
MSALDWFVLLGAMLGIAAYGMWHARGRTDLRRYLKGNERTSWVTIGLSVMATQASAITFLSTPGQGYADGLKFVQIYFGLPIALIIIAAVFLPLYRRLNVFTAYEFLGRRFDGKTRLLGAGLFLTQRGLGAGLTIYAPSIVVSTVLGWPLDLTIVLSGVLVIVYTVSGGSEAVNVTQKYQMLLVIFGLLVAFWVILGKLPEDVSFTEALQVAGSAGRMQAIDYSTDPNNRYTIWTGILGGVFLSLAYFGTVPGAALPVRQFVARKPAGPDVQRRPENPHAILHPAVGNSGVRVLSVRASALDVQPGGVAGPGAGSGRPGSPRARGTLRAGAWLEGTASARLARRAPVRRRARRKRGPRRDARSRPPDARVARRGRQDPHRQQSQSGNQRHRLRLHHLRA